jgi:hypothetical protein
MRVKQDPSPDEFPAAKPGLIKRILLKIASFFGEKQEPLIPLPTSVPLFEEFVQACRRSVPELSTLTDDSLKFTVASMILGLPPTQSYKRISYFSHSLRKAAANEISWNCIQGLKEKQKLEAEKAKQVAADLVQIGQAQAASSGPVNPA